MSTVSPNRPRRIKEQLDDGNNHYGEWTSVYRLDLEPGWMMN